MRHNRVTSRSNFNILRLTNSFAIRTALLLALAVSFFATLFLPATNLAALAATPPKKSPRPIQNQLLPPPPAKNVGYGRFSTKGRNIIDENGTVITLTAVSWYGLDTDAELPDGLYARNYKDILNSIKALGYNTIRLPFSTQTLASQVVVPQADRPGYSYFFNPELAGLRPIEVLDKIVDYAGQIGLKLILTRHRWTNDYASPDFEPQLWYDNKSWPVTSTNVISISTEARWLADWNMLATRYRYTTAVIGADLHNEPHSDNPPDGICWGCVAAAQVATPDNPTDPNLGKDWRLAAERAGRSIHQANPHWLIFVEGIDKYPYTGNQDYNWWGGQLQGVATAPVRTTVAFTGTNGVKIDRVVYSPHEYGPALYCQPWFQTSDYTTNITATMFARYDKYWGFIQKNNLAPVWIGEFATTLDSVPTGCLNNANQNVADTPWFNTLMQYISDNNLNWSYWAVNSSTQLGGIFAKTPVDDWQTVVYTKENLLSPHLQPWSSPNYLLIWQNSDNGKTIDNSQIMTQSGTFSWALAKDAENLGTMLIRAELPVGSKVITVNGVLADLRPGLTLQFSCSDPIILQAAPNLAQGLRLNLQGNVWLEGLQLRAKAGTSSGLRTLGLQNTLRCVRVTLS